MKIFLMVFAMTFAGLVSQARTCFVAQKPAPSFVPKTVCLESLNVNSDGGTGEVAADTLRSEKKILKMTSFNRQNENRASFEAQGNLVEEWESGCFSSESVLVLLKGTMDTRYTPQVDPAQLTLSVRYSYITDNCHNPRREQELEYVQVR
jgi:hypothetical protein